MASKQNTQTSTRSTQYNQNRDFKRGEVFVVDFPKEPNLGEPSRVIQGPHRAVVLYDSIFPRKTVVVIPISSLYDNTGQQRQTIHTDVLLNGDEYVNAEQPYKFTVVADSFIKTEQIKSVSRNLLESKKGKLLEKDMLKLDIQLLNTLGLNNTVALLIEEEVQRRLQAEVKEED
ncbi:type II toxin-antitoxin system PemK/MazF family toxin [Gottfriedia solisilvae]|uniref:type II toxin-antitoxin system PemK/MazF family toxin n=1 Tax=Gottfriedia solisilvae TaxID=1516104 RepID=UPI003D2F09A1